MKKFRFGMPVVGFKAGAPETITVPEYSEFADCGNIDALKESVIEFAKKSFDKKAISEEARKKYSKERMAGKYIEIYSKEI